MKIAISTDGSSVSEHFGRCPSFTIIEIEGSNLISKKVIDNPGHHPGFLPEFLAKEGVGAIVAGGMGQRALMLFEEQDIKTILGISGNIDEIIEKILHGTLEGAESLCSPGAGRGYGIDKTECEHPEEKEQEEA